MGRRLRSRMSAIFRDLNILYRKIVSLSNGPPKNLKHHTSIPLPNIDSEELKSLRNDLFSRIIALDPLLNFSQIEPRLEGRFQTDSYRDIISCMHQLLDRLECMRLCVGDRPFEEDILRLIRNGLYATSRKEMLQTIRVLLYIYSSVMLTKLKILPNLPNASLARDRMIHEFIGILQHHSTQVEGSVTDEKKNFSVADALEGMPTDPCGMLATLRSEKWMRLLGMSVSLREVSRVVDQMGPCMKAVFGEYPDIAGAEEVGCGGHEYFPIKH
ncbi:hypothetical protein HDU98_011605 [Podochytrium sp. JEL0797]|nr:hypothetical protein HDU98_011605 [Podochytrium sp. JEL0797]